MVTLRKAAGSGYLDAAQSPAAGDPDPVGPPTLLSLTDVNTTGDDTDPAASTVPSTVRETPSALMTVPGSTVSESPRGSWRLQFWVQLCDGLGLSVVGGFLFGWRHAADRGVQLPFVVPVDVAGGGQLYVGSGLPWPCFLDQLGLVRADRRLHQGVVQRVPDGADRGVDPGLDQVSGERETGLLRPGIRMVHQIGPGRLPVPVAPPQRYLQGVQHQLGPLVRGGAPADDGA